MNEPHDPDVSADIAAVPDSLDAGLAAGFGRPATQVHNALASAIELTGLAEEIQSKPLRHFRFVVRLTNRVAGGSMVATPPSFDQGRDAFGQDASIERYLDPDGPTLVKVVKKAGRYSRPIVDRQGNTSWRSL
jgi:hypothetical protein